MKKLSIYLFGLSVLMMFGACKDKEPAIGMLELEFENQVAGTTIVLGTGTYKNAQDQSFKVEGLKYMISNVKLYKEGTLMYSESDSYHLVDQSDESTLKVVLDSVPIDEFDQMEFSLGVDAAHNDNLGAGGDLGTGNGLFWAGWGNYIFWRFDGFYTDNGANDFIAYHIGGDNNYNTYSVDLSVTPVIVTEATVSTVHTVCHVDELFGNPNTIDISKIQTVAAAGTTMDSVGVNLSAGIFEVHHVHNGE